MQNQIVPIEIAEIFAGVNELQDKFDNVERPEDEGLRIVHKQIGDELDTLRIFVLNLIEEHIIHWAKAKNQSKQ